MLRMLFFLLINVKIPTIIGFLTFMCRKNFNLIELEICFYNLGTKSYCHSFALQTVTGKETNKIKNNKAKVIIITVIK